ncbi:hypothetical protein J2X11_000018 [Aeromicrobium panaciterrae]|uniref:Uncharacterized protein n=1 Tax=Aeromicrobium panaciterrae TaxID=363861 RepID=A0ABU1UJ23_9ACTN|nr:hypothetical protein [Aeromicrobium panaciterrae]MDR7085179.1 hypothetical protein [Aeromicrobium panaciterrae]
MSLPTGLLFSESTLHTDAFAVLAAFVAINTVMYMALSVSKMLPKIYVSDWIKRANRRSQTRSIHPDPPKI